MQFQRIKITGQRVELAWAKARADGCETKATTLGSTDAPMQSFVDAMQAFKPIVLRILELDDATYGDSMVVQSVSLNEEEDGRRGIVITSLKALTATQAPVVLNTPYLREDVDGTGEKGFMLRGMMDRIEELEGEAERYYKGHRAQRDMFAKDEKKSAEKDLDDRTTVEMSFGGVKTGKMTMSEFKERADLITGRASRRKA